MWHLNKKKGYLPLCQNQRHFYHDGTEYLEHLCLLKQNTVVPTKPLHVRLCWMETLAQTTSGWCTPVPFLLHIHLHRGVYMCTYPCVCPERKTTSITVIFTHCWKAFWSISFMLWPWASVKNLVQCSPQRHVLLAENKQDRTASGLALTFQQPPIPPHTYPLLHCLGIPVSV